MTINLNKSDSYLYISDFLIGKINFEFLEISKSLLIDSGFYHLFVISGFHIGLLFVIIFKLLTFLNLILLPNLNLRFLITIFTLFICTFYVYLCDFPISALRAIIIIVIYYIFYCLKLKTNNFNCLIIILIFLIVFDNEIIKNPGFWFSFSNSLALIYCLSRQKNIINNSPINNLIKTSLICFFASTPISFYFFNKIQFAGIISNLIAVPFFTLILFPISILAFLTKTNFITEIAIFTHKTLIIFAEFISNIIFLNVELYHFDLIEFFILLVTCFLILITKLKYFYLGILIIITMVFDFNKNTNIYLKLSGIPRIIKIHNYDKILTVINGSKFNKNIGCSEKSCELSINKTTIFIIKNSLQFNDFQSKCQNYDLIINLASNNFNCYSKNSINALTLYLQKKITVKFNENSF